MNAYFLSLKSETPNRDYWDYGFLDDYINGRLWKTYEWVDYEQLEVMKLPKDSKAIVVVPARHHAGLEEKINKELQNIDKVVLFLMGDEEASFDVEKIKHPDISIWVQNAHPGRHDKYNRIGTGYPQAIRQLDGTPYKKDLDVYFSGQITHPKRADMWASLEDYPGSIMNKTGGFTQGVTPEIYYKYMSRAKVVPSPAGAVIPDSFRTFEAMECMAIPVADDKNSLETISNYWDWLFNDIAPFPRIQNSEAWPSVVAESVDNYNELIQKQTAWWIKYKRDFAYKIKEQLQ